MLRYRRPLLHKGYKNHGIGSCIYMYMFNVYMTNIANKHVQKKKQFKSLLKIDAVFTKTM